MTNEERKSKMETLKNEAESLAQEYNVLMLDGKLAEAAGIDAQIEEKIGEYTGHARDITFEECKAAENPMIAAVTKLSYLTIAVKDEKKEDGTFSTRSIIDKERPIDLLRLHKYCGGIGANPNWADIAQKMNFLLTAQKAIDLGLNPKDVNDSYAMSEIAAKYDMGKNPTSKTNMLRTLTTVIQAMLGEEYKPVSHDVNFLLSVYSRKNRRALTVSCANHRSFRNYIAEICHRIVTGKSYALDYKVKKQ